MILLTGLFFSRSFFTFRNLVKSNVLIIEAWISPFEVEHAVPLMNSDSVSRVIIVGKNYPDDSDSIFTLFQNKFDNSPQPEKLGKGGIWLFTNSSLAFDLKDIPFTDLSVDSLAIGIRAKGSEAAGYFAHFNLTVNGKYCGGAFTSAVDSVFNFRADILKEDLQSIIVHFDNDLVHRNHDRNLNILSLIVGETEIKATNQNTILIKNAGKYSNGFDSQVCEMKNYLVQL